MNTGRTIRKFLFITMWVIIGGGMLTLLIAAIGKKNRELCSDYQIRIKGAVNNVFVNAEDVQDILVKSTGSVIKNRPVSSFDLLELENILEKNPWVRDAELYFDNRDMLHINISAREPVARVFTSSGRSFYLDSNSIQMPLSDKLSAQVPVFTGFPDNKILRKKDSILLKDISRTAQFILRDPFWMAQVAQLDITATRQFEMVPVIGNHNVVLGNSSDIASKFNRLYLFYKQVMAKTGFDAYKLIDVRFKGQVIAVKQPKFSRIDSVQLRQNVEKLLEQSRQGREVLPPTSDRDLMKTDSVSFIDPKAFDNKTTNKQLNTML